MILKGYQNKQSKEKINNQGEKLKISFIMKKMKNIWIKL